MHSIGVRYRRPKCAVRAGVPSVCDQPSKNASYGSRGTSKGNFAFTLFHSRAMLRKRHAPAAIHTSGRSVLAAPPYGAGPPVHATRQDRQCRLPLSSSRIVGPASTPGLLPFVDVSPLRAAGGRNRFLVVRSSMPCASL